MEYTFLPDEAYARKMDSEDGLAKYRAHFMMPENNIYMDGNSLGLISDEAEKSLLRVLNEWKTLSIKGWMQAQRPWFYFAEEIGAMASTLVGAAPEQVMLTGTTTVNIHSLISTFYDPKPGRTKILADELTFPSDIYALQGQVQLKGLNPEKDLILVKSRDGRTIHEEDVVQMMTDDVALVFLPTVLYRSGQLLDIEYLTREAHKRGILIGFDGCHSVGAVPHYFDRWEVDFATWCSYKYLNGGPGCAAFLYVNKKHFNKNPFITGWFGCDKNKQFDMLNEFLPSEGAGKWQISSPGILGSSAVEGSLKIMLDAGIENIRAKSQKLTSYLVYLMQQELTSEPYNYIIGTPTHPDKRSGHIAIEHPYEAVRINEALKSKGVIPDFRPPNVIRIAPIALYNTYQEVWKVVQYLKEIIDNKEYEAFSKERLTVS